MVIADLNKSLLALAYDMTRKPRNTVFIVGAGASQSAGLLLASDLVNKLKNAFEDKLNKILEEHGIDPETASMEAFLSAYKTLTDDEDAPFRFLHKYLSDIDKARNKVLPLGYVILAHFMKQNLIKHIISLNQDELLDRALFKTLGRHFRYVISKSLFKHLRDQIEQNQQYLDNRRILLKPHGTIHLGATLRVDLENTKRFEKDKKVVLEWVLDGKNIVLIGYSFNDGDMQGIILPMAIESKLNNIYVVSRMGTPFEKPGIKGLKSIYKEYKDKHLHLIKIKGGANKFFRELCKALYTPEEITKKVEKSEKNKYEKTKDEIEKETAYYPGITEHRVRDIILSGIKEPTLEEKIYVEIIIIALKTRGKFKTKTLLESYWMRRLIQDYNKKLEDSSKSNEFIKLPLKEILRTLRDEWQIILPTSGAFNPDGETYYLKGGDEEELINDIINKIKDKMNFDPQKVSRGKESEVIKKLKQLMKKLLEEFDYDLISDPIYPNTFGFKKVKLIKNREEFKNSSSDIFKKSNELLVIAETGEFLTTPEKFGLKKEDFQKKIVILGVSDPEGQPKNSFHYHRSKSILEKLKEMGFSKPKFFIPWEENCHHMTLGKEKGLYFYRKNKSTKFCLVEVEGEDLKNLKEYFSKIAKKYGTVPDCV